MARRKGDSRLLSESSVPKKPLTATYQTRIRDYSGIGRAVGDAALSAYAELYRQVERKLFAAVAAGRSAASLKSEYLKRYGIPARMFNAVQVSLEGKVASVKEQQKLRLDSLGRRIARGEGQIAEAAERGRCGEVLHSATWRSKPNWIGSRTEAQPEERAPLQCPEPAVPYDGSGPDPD